VLKLRFGEFTDDLIYNVRGYFSAQKKRDWFNDPVVKKIIKDIDNSIAVKDEYIESPVLGAIPPDRLSDGCKAVILMQVLDKPHIYGSRCGDNCVPSILDIAESKDITLTLHHAMRFPDKFKAYLVESDEYVYSWYDFKWAYYLSKNKEWGMDLVKPTKKID
jgi:hypothetical protein